MNVCIYSVVSVSWNLYVHKIFAMYCFSLTTYMYMYANMYYIIPIG